LGEEHGKKGLRNMKNPHNKRSETGGESLAQGAATGLSHCAQGV
jgi:hypothetical protein